LSPVDDDTEEILDWLDSGPGAGQVVAEGQPVAWRLASFWRRDLAFPEDRIAPGINKWVTTRTRFPPF